MEKTNPVPGERIALLVPCYNEEQTIAQVVRDFQRVLPEAEISVFDNASTDRTTEAARAAGARVVYSPHKGKGNVVRHMFSTIEADIYLMVDGDSTYSADSAPLLLEKFRSLHVDMMVGRRRTPAEKLQGAYRPMHQFGNRFVCWLIGKSFGTDIQDVFSGYRVFGRNFVKSIPLHAKGFEIEIEMTLQALSKDYRIAEIDVPYGSRPTGSFSKLNTYRDGLLVLKAFASICRDYRPGLFFGGFALILFLLSLTFGAYPISDYLLYQYVYHVPLALLATGVAILGALSLCIALILETQLRYHNETHALLRRTPGLEDRHGK